MKKLKGTERETLQFSKWAACLKASGCASVEKLYEKIHAEIRKNPVVAKRAAKTNFNRDHDKKRQKRLTNAQRKKNVQIKIEIRQKELAKLAKKKQ